MEIDWRKVAVSLNGAAGKDLDVAQSATESDSQRAMEFRVRGWILKSIADALFEGLPDEAA